MPPSASRRSSGPDRPTARWRWTRPRSSTRRAPRSSRRTSTRSSCAGAPRLRRRPRSASGSWPPPAEGRDAGVGRAGRLRANSRRPSSSACWPADAPLEAAQLETLSRLQIYLTADASRDPTATPVTRKDGPAVQALRLFDAKTFTPVLLLPEFLRQPGLDRARGRPVLEGGRREPRQRRAARLRAQGLEDPDARRLEGSARRRPDPGGARRRRHEGGRRGRRHPRPDGRRDHRPRARLGRGPAREDPDATSPAMDSSLRIRVASVQGSLDLTIRGPYFFERGKAPDWAWQEFFLNGVKWKGRTIPKLPILQPDKVTTLPLDIRLSEEYDVRARRRDHDRRAPGLPRGFPPEVDRGRQAHLPRHGLDRPGDVRAPAARVHSVEPQGRHAFERPDRVLPRGPRRPRRRASRSRSAASRSFPPRGARPPSSARSR